MEKCLKVLYLKSFLNLSDKENFMEQLWPLMNDVKECYWAGGEPLITTEHWDIMNYWVEQNHSKTINVEIQYKLP